MLLSLCTVQANTGQEQWQSAEQASIQPTADNVIVEQEPINPVIATIHGDDNEPTSSRNNGER